jgi:NADH-quinone oxidoreductase E subunit
VARQVPRTVVRRARGDRDLHARRADRRHDRDRRLARHRHGRGRPLSASLYDEIQAIRAIYPEGSQSAVLPALRLAQRERGWLSPDVLREVADALETTPAYCKSVASFYDQLHLEPVGEHLVEVCTNVSCAVVGAQQVVEAFESELGCRAGETTADGQVTLRTVECLGGCGWATIVAVDNHYRTHVKADGVPAIVEELKSGA